jgi:hypothetical protein
MSLCLCWLNTRAVGDHALHLSAETKKHIALTVSGDIQVEQNMGRFKRNNQHCKSLSSNRTAFSESLGLAASALTI